MCVIVLESKNRLAELRLSIKEAPVMFIQVDATVPFASRCQDGLGGAVPRSFPWLRLLRLRNPHHPPRHLRLRRLRLLRLWRLRLLRLRVLLAKMFFVVLGILNLRARRVARRVVSARRVASRRATLRLVRPDVNIYKEHQGQLILFKSNSFWKYKKTIL